MNRYDLSCKLQQPLILSQVRHYEEYEKTTDIYTILYAYLMHHVNV